MHVCVCVRFSVFNHSMYAYQLNVKYKKKKKKKRIENLA